MTTIARMARVFRRERQARREALATARGGRKARRRAWVAEWTTRPNGGTAARS
jgi:hypothetical protein